MPQMGESIAEGTLSKWLKKVGDAVKRDEPIFEISTDKVDAEIPAPSSGVLAEILVTEGQTVPVQTVVARLETDVNAAVGAAAAQPAAAAAGRRGRGDRRIGAAWRPRQHRRGSPRDRRCLATIRAAAGQRRSDERRQQSRGPAPHQVVAARPPHGGRTRRRDQWPPGKRHRRARHQARPHRVPRSGARRRAAPAELARAAPASRARAASGAMAGRRRRADDEDARADQRSHGHVGRDVGARQLVLRGRLHADRADSRQASRRVREARPARSSRILPFIIKAVTDGLKAFPVLNASVRGNEIIYRKQINIGIAVALDWGLIVPVIKRADNLSLTGLTRTLNDLASRARTKKLDPREVQDGTFTITNPGVFGSLMGTPIINQPQVGILCLGTIEKRPKVITGADGEDTIAIRTCAYLSLSFDHRIVDGADADKFMSFIKKNLETFPEAVL